MDLRAWTLASRTRYAVVYTAINVATGLGITALGGSSFSSRYWLWAIPAVLVALVLHARIWYPRAKRRADASSRVSRPA